LNARSFAASIEMLLENPDLLLKMKENIKQKYSEGEFSWPFIANETINFYKKHLLSKDLIP
jgi:glycosyltransferase involved in cell wall biosynthesis